MLVQLLYIFHTFQRCALQFMQLQLVLRLDNTWCTII